MIGNTSYLPLVLVASVAVDEPELFGVDAAKAGVAYTAVSMVCVADPSAYK